MGLIGNEPEQKVENLSICGYSSPWKSVQPATTEYGTMFEMISLWIWINAEENFLDQETREGGGSFSKNKWQLHCGWRWKLMRLYPLHWETGSDWRSCHK